MIKEILKTKGDKQYLYSKNTTLVIEEGGNYKNYDWIITFNDLGFRCGYVAIPTDNKLFKKFKKHTDNLDYFSEFDVHGGITYARIGGEKAEQFIEINNLDELWLGFDCGHAGDEEDYELVKIIWNEENFIKHIQELQNIKNRSKNIRNQMYKEFNVPILGEWKPRSKEYLKKELEGLIDQLIEREKVIYDRQMHKTNKRN